MSNSKVKNLAPRIRCDICFKLIARKHISRHKRGHNSIKKFTCETCSTNFTTTDALKVHIDRDHHHKPYPCNVCGRDLRSGTLLLRHLHHNDPENKKLVRCPHCCTRFVSKLQYNKHTATHCGGTLLPEDRSGTLINMKNSPKQASSRSSSSSSSGNNNSNPSSSSSSVKNVSTPSSSSSSGNNVSTPSSSSSSGNNNSTPSSSSSSVKNVSAPSSSSSSGNNVSTPRNQQVKGVIKTKLPSTDDPPHLGPAKKMRLEYEQDERSEMDEGSGLDNNESGLDNGYDGDEDDGKLEEKKGSPEPELSKRQQIVQPSKLIISNNPLPTSSSVTQAVDNDPKTKYLSFMFENWGLTFQREEDCDSLVYEKIVLFAQGKKFAAGYEDFTIFLQKNPETLAGKFVIGVMVYEFCLKSQMDVTLQLYEYCNKYESIYSDIVSRTTEYILQRAISVDFQSVRALLNIPKSILSVLNFDDDFFRNGNRFGIRSVSENFFLAQVNTSLTQLILDWIDQDDQGIKFCNKENAMTRTSFWGSIARFITQRNVAESQEYLSQLLVLRNRELQINTKPYLNVNVDNKPQTIHLHAAIIEAHSSTASPAIESSLNVNQSDVDLLVDLLYKSKLPGNCFSTKLSTGFLDMLNLLKLQNIWKLYFGNMSYKDAWNKHTGKGNILVIAIKAKVDDFFTQNLNEINEYFKLRAYHNVTKQLCAEDVKYLAKKLIESDFGHFEVYKLLLQWCFGMCGLTIGNEDNVEPGIQKVQDLLESVHSVLEYEKMAFAEKKRLFHDNYYPRIVILRTMRV